MKKIKHRLPTVSKLRKKLETSLHRYVRIRDKRKFDGRCIACLARPISCAYHILPAGDYPGTRYDEDNVIGACRDCNAREHYHRLVVSAEWRKKLGNEWYEAMQAKGRQIKKWDRSELMERIDYFERKRRAVA